MKRTLLGSPEDLRRGVLRTAGVLLLVWGLTGAFVPAAGERPIVIRGVRIFDGERLLSKGTVIVRGERIEAVGSELVIPDGAEVIDGSGRTLLPGLIDAHVHIWDEANLRQCLIFGVTSVVDMFMDKAAMQRIKQKQAEGGAGDMSHLTSPGILATAPKGHGTQYGLAIPTLEGPEDAAGFVKDRVAEGSDFIKIIYDDGSAYGFTRATLDLDTIRAVIREAHAHEKKVVVHAASLRNCMDVLEAGADGLAHMFFDNGFHPDFGRLAARREAFVIPTLSVLQPMGGAAEAAALAEDPALAPYIKPSDLTGLKMTFPFETGMDSYRAAEKGVRQLKEAAVPILAGTDAPNPGTAWGASLHRELVLLVRAGLTPIEALRAATSRPADAFAIPDRGRIRKGKAADLLLIEGDPTLDITATRRIAGIWKAGKRVDRAAYLKEVEGEKLNIEKLKSAPPPEYGETGLISDFEQAEVDTRFGSGWMVSTDAMMGGKSQAKMALSKGGAEGSSGALLIRGTVSPGSSNTWAGVMFSPGPRVMAPANLSAKSSISFSARGDGRTFSVMIFAQSLGFLPAMQSFKPGPDWREFELSFEQFGVEGYDIMGIFLGSSLELGEFTLSIDNVRLK